nr:hypothetical protein [Tanacetum cinerariifolium]
MNGLKISNLTQETLLGPAFRLLKGTRSNYAELEYDFEECYKALSEKLDWENPEGGDYPFDLTKPLPLCNTPKNGCRNGILYRGRSRKDKYKDEGPSAGSDRVFKKRMTSKDAKPTTGPKSKDSTSGSSKGKKSHPKSSRKNVQSIVPEFEVVDTNMPQDQGGNLGNDDDEPRKESVSKRDWFTKPTRPQEPTDPNWNIGKTPMKGPTQSWLMTLSSSSSTDKSLKAHVPIMLNWNMILKNVTRLFQKNLIGRIQKAGTIHLILPNPFLYVTPPKMGVAIEYCTGALLHNITAL